VEQKKLWWFGCEARSGGSLRRAGKIKKLRDTASRKGKAQPITADQCGGGRCRKQQRERATNEKKNL